MKSSAILFVALVISAAYADGSCKLMGYYRDIKIEGCELVKVFINACRGCCRSVSYSSDYATIARSHWRHNITSKSSCCIIHTLVEQTFTIRCGGNIMVKSIYSAKECRCGLCEEV